MWGHIVIKRQSDEEQIINISTKMVVRTSTSLQSSQKWLWEQTVIVADIWKPHISHF